MQSIMQDPGDPRFVQDPYAFYDTARAMGRVVWWHDYAMPALTTHADVTAALKHRALTRVPPDGLPPFPAHLRAFGRVEALSLLSLEGADHARLRKLVLRAFTTGRVARLADEIGALCHDLIDRFPDRDLDLVAAYTARVPVIVIARLLGVPESACDSLLDWSHAMVAVYRPNVTPTEEHGAERAAAAFTAWLESLIGDGGIAADGLLAELRRVEADGDLARQETLATAILLLNAGHEATVHALGLAAVRLIRSGAGTALTRPGAIDRTVEECLRIDPPLHVFTRWVQHDTTIGGHDFARGDQVACLLGAANRDPSAYRDPHVFRPGRPGPTLTSFGAGTHFCLGAPLARLEMQIALQALFARRPDLTLAGQPRLADIYHFHGYRELAVAP